MPVTVCINGLSLNQQVVSIIVWTNVDKHDTTHTSIVQRQVGKKVVPMAAHRKTDCSLLDVSGKGLHRSEIIQQFPSLIWHSGIDGRCDYFNHAWLAFTGRTFAQELGDGWADGVHPEDLAGCLKIYREAFEARQPFEMEYRLRHHDGSYRWITDHGCPHYALDGNFCGYIGSCYDITHHKTSEEALRHSQDALSQLVEQRTEALEESHQLLESISRQVPGGIYQFRLFPDGHYCIPYASQSMIELFEVDPDEVQHDASRLFSRILPEDLPGMLDSIHESARTLAPWQHEFRAVSPSKGPRWFRGDSRPQRQPDGSVLWYGFVTDVTERKELEKQLTRARKLEFLGQLAAGVAHEVRNPLNAILTVSEALFREPALCAASDLEPYISHIRSQVNRLARLMNDLLDLGRPISRDSLQPVLLVDLCRQTIRLWQQTGVATNFSVELIVTPAHERLQVRADRDRLQQIMFNLLENAGQHSPVGGRISLVLDEQLAKEGCEQVSLRVVDQGSGIAPELVEQVFEPFYSSRKGGSGLGLTLVRQFADQMGGSVRITSNAPKPGCTVLLQLPLYRDDNQT